MPRETITREAIVDTALRLLDRDGLDALSMRRVADALGTGAASLYWHVPNKDALLDLLFDRIIGEHRVPDPDPERWTEQLKDVARDVRRVISSHRDVVRLSLGRIPVGPNALANNERLLAILRAGGLSDHLAVIASHLLFVLVNGFAIEEAGVTRRDGDAGQADDARAYFASLPPEQFPNLIAVADEMTSADMDERFELLLALFVDGLAARAR